MKPINIRNQQEATRKACARRQLSRSTAKVYSYWVGQYLIFLGKNALVGCKHPAQAFIDQIAATNSKSTVHQAFNALVFYCRHVLNREIPPLTKPEGKPSRRAPVVLSPDEVQAIMAHLTGNAALQCALMYGAGLRVSEALQLRLKDIDFDMNTITVRGGKGDKDRVTILPGSLRKAIEAQARKATDIWDQDRVVDVFPGVESASLQRKLGRSAKLRPWAWFFPSRSITAGVRWHTTAQGLSKALQSAARKTRIQKHVTPHVFRHSFATSMLISGNDIRTIQELLGHKSVKTTMIYTHAIPPASRRIVSPVDQMQGNVLSVDFGHSRNQNSAARRHSADQAR